MHTPEQQHLLSDASRSCRSASCGGREPITCSSQPTFESGGLLSEVWPHCHLCDLGMRLTFLEAGLCICKQWTVKTQGSSEESGRPSAQIQVQSNVKLTVMFMSVSSCVHVAGWTARFAVKQGPFLGTGATFKNCLAGTGVLM